MKNPDAIFGRLGNRMFQGAFLYAEARKRGVDFYFQDPKYFAGYEDEIKQLFGDGIGYLDQVGVHVRRGLNPSIPTEPKYNENPFYFNICNTDYYERAMAMFPEDNFLVFSDDPEWCKEKWKDNPRVQVMDKRNEIEDFNLLASCKHQIIANSSFSLWCGILNPNEGKKVIAPIESKYYSDGIIRTKYPSYFTQIDFEYVKPIK